MKALRHIRIALGAVMLFECIAWVVMGASAPEHSRTAVQAQVVPALLGATIGAGGFWLLVTLILGRVYCAAICPVGILGQGVCAVRRRLPGRKGRRMAPRHTEPTRTRWVVLGIYVCGTVASIGCVPLLLDPFPAFANSLGHAVASVPHTLAFLGTGTVAGAICAVASALFAAVYAWCFGRDLCNDICPVGTLLRLPARYAAMQITLEPDKCTGCLKCEDVCEAHCMNIATRTIDNERCIRCFDCLAACPHKALRYTVDRNGIATFLLQKNRQPHI